MHLFRSVRFSVDLPPARRTLSARVPMWKWSNSKRRRRRSRLWIISLWAGRWLFTIHITRCLDLGPSWTILDHLGWSKSFIFQQVSGCRMSDVPSVESATSCKGNIGNEDQEGSISDIGFVLSWLINPNICEYATSLFWSIVLYKVALRRWGLFGYLNFHHHSRRFC